MIEDQIRSHLRRSFIPKYFQKWESSSRKREYFVKKHKDFLDNHLNIQIDIDRTVQDVETKRADKRGRPLIEPDKLDDSSGRTKRRKIAEFNGLYGKLTGELKERESVHSQDASTPPSVSANNRADSALANYMDLKLSQNRYQKLRNFAMNDNNSNGNLHPPYRDMLAAKNRCYPDGIEITETEARVNFQNLLDHTSRRILMTLPKETLAQIQSKTLKLFIKWGMDGLSGLPAIKQKWRETLNEILNFQQPLDSSLFMVCMVPLKLIAEDNETIWENPTPSSVAYCRPVHFEYTKETAQNTMKVYKFYEKEIENLQPFTSEVLGEGSQVYYDCKCTMNDGKTCSVLTGQKCSSNCNLCGAKPSQINDLAFVKNLPLNEDFLDFGLSPLHCRIRFMEHLLHVAYNLDFQRHQAYGEQLQTVKAARKFMIQTQIKSELGLTVDVVKTGSGTTNDGNTSRRFFETPETIARILGINLRLVEMYKVILEVINCSNLVDENKFRDYCYEAADLYVTEYDWYPFPPSVHKALMHGWRIVKRLQLAVGAYSEEAQECNNKILKRARAENSRRCDRVSSNEDVLHHLLVSSDPLITHKRAINDKVSKGLSPEAQSLMADLEGPSC